MKCPNCSKEIGIFELAPNCKHCGVNIFYAQQETLLTEDAKKCELEYATFHILVSKLKSAFISGKIQIMRIVAMVLAIGAIFVPFAVTTIDFGLFTSQISFGAFGIYQAFSDGTLQAVLNLSSYTPEITNAVLLLLGLIVLIFLCGLGVFVTLLLSFINIQKTAKIMKGFSLAGIFIALLSLVVSFAFSAVISNIGFAESEAGFGSVACLIILAVIFALNRLIITKNIQPEIKAVDVERLEIRRQIKNGELSYDDLSLPVLESEEEREKRLLEEEKNNQLAQSAKQEVEHNEK